MGFGSNGTTIAKPIASLANEAKGLGKSVLRMPIIPMLVIIWIFFSYSSKAFLTVGNVSTMLSMSTYLAIAVIGQTYVTMTGGIDLSMAQVLACSSVASALVMERIQHNAITAAFGVSLETVSGEHMTLFQIKRLEGIDPNQVDTLLSSIDPQTIMAGLATALLVGLAFGLINGICIGRFDMTPFIVTLAIQLVARGISFAITQALSVPVNIPALVHLSYSKGIPIGDGVIPWTIVIAVVLMILFGLVLGRSDWGQQITLLGSNPSAARYAGIKVKKIRTSVYVLSSTMAGLAGFMSLICLGSADPKKGDTILMTIIGAIILGGVNPNGGEGSILKAGLGIFFFATLTNGLTFLNLNLSYQQIILGIIVMVGMAAMALIDKKTSIRQ